MTVRRLGSDSRLLAVLFYLHSEQNFIAVLFGCFMPPESTVLCFEEVSNCAQSHQLRKGTIMARERWLDIARATPTVPLAVDIACHNLPGIKIRSQKSLPVGPALIRAAARYNAPFIFSKMDLTREQATLARSLGLSEPGDLESFHFNMVPEDGPAAELSKKEWFSSKEWEEQLSNVMYAHANSTLPVLGSAIGVFTLITKMMQGEKAIVAVSMHGSGETATGDPDVALLLWLLPICEKVVTQSVTAQLNAGAAGIMIADPAAQVNFIPPSMPEMFEKFVVEPNRRIRELIERRNADLFFHCCGELVPEYVSEFGHSIHPTVLSLGSSRCLWEDAKVVPKDVVLYGNVPSKHFVSKELTADAVTRQCRQLRDEMGRIAHPFILGTECDTLHVPGNDAAIDAKLNAMFVQ